MSVDYEDFFDGESSGLDFYDDQESEEPDRYYDRDPDFDDEFADPGGNSALRAATPNNPRDRPCPTCHEPNVLTRRDVQLGYQCDNCADRAELGY